LRQQALAKFIYRRQGNYNRFTRGPEKDPPEHDPADSLACSGLRAQLRLEQQLLRSQDGSVLWLGKLSSEIIVEIGLYGQPLKTNAA
jgi:hypothetical protein